MGYDIDISEDEAIFCLLVAVLNADGEITEQEQIEFGKVFTQMNRFEGMTVEELFPAYNGLYTKFNNDAEKIADAVLPTISKEGGIAVYSFCLELMLFDGPLKSDEENLAGRIKKAFALEDAMAGDILKVMSGRANL